VGGTIPQGHLPY